MPPLVPWARVVGEGGEEGGDAVYSVGLSGREPPPPLWAVLASTDTPACSRNDSNTSVVLNNRGSGAHSGGWVV